MWLELQAWFPLLTISLTITICFAINAVFRMGD
jgi:hypothetical protein